MKKIALLLALCAFNVVAKPVNINKADAKTIASSLHGIGQKKAEAIVQFRKAHGKFKTLKDLTQVKGIGEKTVKKNAADIKFKNIKKKAKSK